LFKSLFIAQSSNLLFHTKKLLYNVHHFVINSLFRPALTFFLPCSKQITDGQPQAAVALQWRGVLLPAIMPGNQAVRFVQE